MSKLTVITTAEAQADISGIVEYIRTDNKKSAYEFAKKKKKIFIYLSEFPKMGRKRPEYTDEDVLFFTIKWGYTIVYNIQADKICILRVLSEYQDCSLLF